MHKDAKQIWEEYKERELKTARTLLAELGYRLDEVQVHTGGERYLMTGNRDVGGGGYKLVLTGERVSDRKKVIIKISSERGGISEIEAEHRARNTITNLPFAYHSFVAPEELYFGRKGEYLVSIVGFIEQEKPFLERTLQEQFLLALRAFKIQEGAHMTAYRHARAIGSGFGVMHSQAYLDTFASFVKTTLTGDPGNGALARELEQATLFLAAHQETIEQYCGFLTHADFVPHNVRTVGQDIHLLDYASIHFGNKYENWARFCNFMLLYNKPLEEALVQYVHDNRTQEELLSLRLMRVYKIGFLLSFYAESLGKTGGDQHELTRARIAFWTNVLHALIHNTPISADIIALYQQTRDSLRSSEEKKRQEKLH